MRKNFSRKQTKNKQNDKSFTTRAQVHNEHVESTQSAISVCLSNFDENEEHIQRKRETERDEEDAR